MNEEPEYHALDFGTRQGTRDKLTYRQVLYNVVMQYLNSFGYFNSKKAVEKIIHATRFDEPGMELKTQIAKIVDDMKIEKKKRFQQLKKEMGGFNFKKKSTQSKLKITIQQWYWDELFDRILQVLADNQFIVDHNKIQKIRMKKSFSDIEDEQHIEGAVEDLYT